MWQEHEQATQRRWDWNEVDGENYRADTRDKARPHNDDQQVVKII